MDQTNSVNAIRKKNEQWIGQSSGKREHVNIVAENTNFIRKKIAQYTRKPVITSGKEAILLTAVITSNMGGSNNEKWPYIVCKWISNVE